MGKFLTGVVVGVFVGALTLEIIERSYPELREKIRDAARRARERARDAAGHVHDSVRRGLDQEGYY